MTTISSVTLEVPDLTAWAAATEFLIRFNASKSIESIRRSDAL